MIIFELWTHGVLDESDTLSEKAARDIIRQAIDSQVPVIKEAEKQFFDCMLCLAGGRGVEIENESAGTKLVFKPKTKANQDATLKLLDGGKE